MGLDSKERNNMATIKGQNLRIMLAGPSEVTPTCVAAARSCSVHLSVEMGDMSTKDSESDWAEQEPVGINWDAQVESLVIDDLETNAKHAERLVVGQTYTLLFSRTSNAAGGKNREGINSAVNLAGYAILNDLQIQSQNREAVVATAQFTGKGDLHFSPAAIRDWVNASEYGTFQGIAQISTTGPAHDVAVAVAEHEIYGTTLFLIAHNGICTTPTEETGRLTSLTDLTGYSAESNYNNIKDLVLGLGYNMPNTLKDGVYDYISTVGTGLIGNAFIGELESTN